MRSASSNMTVWIVAISLLLCVSLIGCDAEQPVCSAPYIANGNTCCLDKDNDTRCDASSGSGAGKATPPQGLLDCSLCPPQFVTQREEVIVYRYVCQNKSVMDSAEACGTAVLSNAASLRPNTMQDDAYIVSFDAEPACRGALKAAELRLVLAEVPINITYEVEDAPDAMPRPVYFSVGKSDSYLYVGFCDGACGDLVDISLAPTSAYLVRAVLRYPDKTVNTRDIIIDPTPDGAYGRKRCG